MLLIGVIAAAIAGLVLSWRGGGFAAGLGYLLLGLALTGLFFFLFPLVPRSVWVILLAYFIAQPLLLVVFQVIAGRWPPMPRVAALVATVIFPTVITVVCVVLTIGGGGPDRMADQVDCPDVHLRLAGEESGPPMAHCVRVLVATTRAPVLSRLVPPVGIGGGRGSADRVDDFSTVADRTLSFGYADVSVPLPVTADAAGYFYGRPATTRGVPLFGEDEPQTDQTGCQSQNCAEGEIALDIIRTVIDPVLDDGNPCDRRFTSPCLWQALNRGTVITNAAVYDAKTTFQTALSRELRVRSGTTEIGSDGAVLLYIHGFNQSFERAAADVAAVSVDYDLVGFGRLGEARPRGGSIGWDGPIDTLPKHVFGVPVLFTWPSHESVCLYPCDRQRAQDAGVHLRETILSILELGAVDQLNIVVHSMGNRVFMEALQDLSENEFKDNPGLLRRIRIIHAAADISPSTFERGATAWRNTPNWGAYGIEERPQTLIYASKFDKALGISRLLKGYKDGAEADRIGFVGWPDRPFVFDEPDVTTVDATRYSASGGWVDLHHGYFIARPTVIGDSACFFRNDAAPLGMDRDRNLNPQYREDGSRYFKLVSGQYPYKCRATYRSTVVPSRADFERVFNMTYMKYCRERVRDLATLLAVREGADPDRVAYADAGVRCGG